MNYGTRKLQLILGMILGMVLAGSFKQKKKNQEAVPAQGIFMAQMQHEMTEILQYLVLHNQLME